MSFGFLGIQFGFALQNANTSRIFQTLGADMEKLPILWIAAPVTGLIVQPIVGHLSDRTWGKLGRRRPFFLTGAILASIALVIMPNSPFLWIAAGMLWIMDASINISMEPFRALVADLLPSEQRTSGFAIQSFFIGVGAVVASLLPFILTNWLGISNTAGEGEIPYSVKLSYYLGAIAFLGAVLWTVFRTKEIPPQNLEEFYTKKRESAGLLKGTAEILDAFIRMPKTMIQLAFVQFFSWFALFCMWIYTTPAVTKHIYHTTDTSSAAYNEGADWVGVLFAVYNGIAAILSFLLPVLAARFSRKGAHIISLVLTGVAFISFMFINSPELLVLPMIFIGLGWASILSMPYAMLAGSLPQEKMGVYMGIFNFFIVIPQIVAATIIGFIVHQFFNDDPIYALVIGGFSLLVAAFLTTFVSDEAPSEM
ncbi:MAG: MFS transporter [Ignavibacteriales bacterium]|nr:MAG: SLC45 family MFS transporter [Ignavibacteriaceae bacterium]MBW7874103.1 SLC45 family MFS transporter [Ignavibacteria bacterium]MCZ2143203.1 MFS transporter [Ignavibacteriales bacterium]OQY70143.1 MAG: MFS transporter [Ignavibacteriales bacterium UTCHB3]